MKRSCHAIQIFNQNPRGWRPRDYSAEEIAEFHEAMAASDVGALMIHAVYLLNCASEDPEIRIKSLASLTASLQAGAALGAHCVVLHPGSALKGGGPAKAAMERAAAVIAEALADSEECPLHLENTAGAGGTLGRSFEELATLIDLAGGGERLGVCLDSCHLLASGFDVRTAAAVSATVADFDRIIGSGRLGSLHFNDSQSALGSNGDRHALVGDGELGLTGTQVFMSEPRLKGCR
ncbi:MAG: deoxyribonuclease IV, partial [Actinomycetota bacterium]|nr:deoxyribonuclease IV [Actinomycetota bacterium]